jgi:hypothetical protein
MIGSSFRRSCRKKVMVLVGMDVGCNGIVWLSASSVDAQRERLVVLRYL